MEKVYVLDTNVILHDFKSMFNFVGNKVVIPLSVVEEIDDQKRKQGSIGFCAREFSRQIDDIMEKGRLSEGIYLEDYDITLIIEANFTDLDILPDDLDRNKTDNKILAVAMNYNKSCDMPVILVTRDTSLRIKADAVDLKVENYLNDVVELNELYTGISEYKDLNFNYDRFYSENHIPVDEVNFYSDERPNPNECLLFEDNKQSALGVYKDNTETILPIKDKYPWGLSARNREQKFALTLLMDENINLVSLVGKAGTGKTLLALASGLEQVVEKKLYNKLVVLRPIVPMGNDIGYLPGDEEDKLSAWMRPIKDNLEYLMSDMKDEVTTEYMKQFIDMEALTYIRGRSIPNQFIILDEAQNCSQHELKTILTRVGEGSKVILTGDPYQIDHPYLDSNSNGLTYVTEKMKESKLSGSIVLTKGERSELADEVARKL